MFRMAGLACFALCLVGCVGEEETSLPVMADDHGHDDHDHGEHQHAETPGEAFHELEELYATISKGFADNDEDAAHGPLHEIGHVLEELNELVGKSEVDEATKTAVAEQVETLMDAYGAVDASMHGKEGSEYSEVSEKIDGAIKALESALGDLADHDHDGEDHDDHGDHKEGEHDDHDHAEKK